MKLLVISVFDRAVEAFLTPMFFRTKTEAVRSFTEACKANEQFKSYPQDYVLMQLGTFDDNTGEFVGETAPQTLLLGMQAANAPPITPEA